MVIILATRKKETEEEISYEKVIEFLRGLEGRDIIYGVYREGKFGDSDYRSFSNISPKEVISLLEEHYKPKDGEDCSGKHTVFKYNTGKRKHIINLTRRVIEVEHRRKVSINYLVNNRY